MKPFSKTKSFCPICKKFIGANIIEKGGSMFMEKKCPEHGNFETKIAKYAWYYKGLNNYYNNLYGEDFYKIKQLKGYALDVTSKCNLNCPVCYTKSLNSKPDISLGFIKKQLAKIKNKGLYIHITGGEPTQRDDLPEIIRLIARSGNLAAMNTNGIRIVEERGYLKKLKKSGLAILQTWVDTLKNPEIYKKMRGRDFLDLKFRLFKEVEKLRIPTRIIQTVAKGINDGEISDCLEFARKNKFITALWVRGYNYLGNCGFSPDQEFLSDELAETVANQSNGLFSLEDIYYWQKIYLATLAHRGIALCFFQSPFIFVPRARGKSLRDTFRFEKFSKILDEFEKIWHEDRERAKNYFFSRYSRALLKNPILNKILNREIVPRFGLSEFIFEHYCMAYINNCSNILNYDHRMVQQQCSNCSLNHKPQTRVSRCYTSINYYSPSYKPFLNKLILK